MERRPYPVDVELRLTLTVFASTKDEAIAKATEEAKRIGIPHEEFYMYIGGEEV